MEKTEDWETKTADEKKKLKTERKKFTAMLFLEGTNKKVCQATYRTIK